ncbi:unnamed protein product [Mytilus coruscus]|uniref:CUB domain-containing protein n=1 Tax=Mytilus coruscus TaxID=42192 RepID=A0A6J7ZWP1_MYTCO|nr:unnamed protein product [Mytilus coruscus]
MIALKMKYKVIQLMPQEKQENVGKNFVMKLYLLWLEMIYWISINREAGEHYQAQNVLSIPLTIMKQVCKVGLTKLHTDTTLNNDQAERVVHEKDNFIKKDDSGEDEDETVIGILLVLKDANGTIDLTATPYLQTFVSHDNYGVAEYPGNFSRDWLITGETANYTITIEFQACVLETGNNKGVCIKDKVYIYDGTNSSATLLKETCCGLGDTVPFPVYSTDSTMYILFSTDDTVSDTGFRISYILEGAPTSTVSITTVQVAASTKEDNTLIYIIIACAVTALLIIIIVILICVVCCKKKSKANKTKQKVHKIFGRSAPRPVVVTSESGSEVELEGNSESPRVVQTQHHSPPPAYATVVKEENQNSIPQQNRENSKQNNSAQNNNDKKKSSGKNRSVEKENIIKVEKEKHIKVEKENSIKVKVEKENSIKVEKEKSIKQTNEPNPIKEIDPPTKKETNASSGSKIKNSKKTDEISKEKKTVPTKIETGKNPGKLSEEEANSTRAQDIDNESDTKNNVRINEKEHTDTKSEERNKRNVKSQIKDLNTSPDKKDIYTRLDNKAIDTTPDTKDIDTTLDKKDIDTTPDKKDIDASPDKKVISKEECKAQKGKTDNRALDEHVDIIENDQQNSKILKSEKTKTIPKPHEYGLLDTEEINKPGRKTENTNSGTEQIRTHENKEITNEIEKSITFKSPKPENRQRGINEDLKNEKKTISNTISPISNKQHEETDEKEDKRKVETHTQRNQKEIQSNMTKDKDKNNNRADVHNKRLTYCEKQSVLTKFRIK